MLHNKPCQSEVLKNSSVDSSKDEYFKNRVIRKLINPPKIKPLAV